MVLISHVFQGKDYISRQINDVGQKEKIIDEMYDKLHSENRKENLDNNHKR